MIDIDRLDSFEVKGRQKLAYRYVSETKKKRNYLSLLGIDKLGRLPTSTGNCS